MKPGAQAEARRAGAVSFSGGRAPKASAERHVAGLAALMCGIGLVVWGLVDLTGRGTDAGTLVSLGVAASALGWWVQPLAAAVVYVGPAGVTTATGMPLPTTEWTHIPSASLTGWFAVTATTATLAVLAAQ